MRDRIVDAALELAEARSWESVRLRQVADKLGITLNQVRREFAEKEDIVDAWFDRADRTMLEAAAGDALQGLDLERRVHAVMMTWFGALRGHRRPTRQMILNKFEPGHLHYQVAGAMRVSRTVQWMREAAGLEDVLPWRAVSEAGLTGIYLATFGRWMFDTSGDDRDTARFLRRQLRRVRPLATSFGRGTRRD